MRPKRDTGFQGGEPTDASQFAGKIAAGDMTAPVVIRPGDKTSVMAAMINQSARRIGDK